MAVDFYDIFSPCAFLYPFSPTVASASSKKIHEWKLYRLFIMVSYIAIVGTFVAEIYNHVVVKGLPCTVINKPSVLTIVSLYFTSLLAQCMMGAKKNKIKKLMDEINDMDDMNFSINIKKYKICNAVFGTLLVLGHASICIVNVLEPKGVLLFEIPITFIYIWTDVEILVLTNFVLVLNAKAAHLALKLENIEKTKEANKEALYEQYRHYVLRILKRINNIWEGRVFLIITFELYFTTRALLKHFVTTQSVTDVFSVFSIICKYVLTLRSFVIYILLGLIGQWTAEKFDRISLLANTIQDMDVADEVIHQMTKISRLAAVVPARMHAKSVIIDGHLPLTAVSAIISTVILMLQFGVTIY